MKPLSTEEIQNKNPKKIIKNDQLIDQNKEPYKLQQEEYQ